MQSLTALLYNVETIAQMDVPPSLTRQAQAMWALTQRIMDDIHNLIYDLRPTLLDKLGLLPALQWLIEQRLKNRGLHTHLTWNGHPFTTDDTLPPLSPEAEIAIFRVCQEAFNNILTHAQAQHVAIHFEQEATCLLITIEDDGIGFDLDEAMQLDNLSKRGLGLLGMWERMELVGGTLILSSSPGQGTVLSLKCPLQKETKDGQDSPASGR